MSVVAKRLDGLR